MPDVTLCELNMMKHLTRSTVVAVDVLIYWKVREKKYERRYNHKFVVKNKDPRKSFIFGLSMDQIKKKVCQSDKWRDIIKAMYPHFPGGYSKVDSLILFFHTVLTQNETDKLKLLLMKFFKY